MHNCVQLSLLFCRCPVTAPFNKDSRWRTSESGTGGGGGGGGIVHLGTLPRHPSAHAKEGYDDDNDDDSIGLFDSRQSEMEAKKAEVRRRLEEQSQSKKKKGFMTPERKKKLRVRTPAIL